MEQESLKLASPRRSARALLRARFLSSTMLPRTAVHNLAARLGARVLALPRNRGFAHAVNSGVLDVNTEWVAIVNSDVILASDWLATLLSAANANQASFACGPITRADQVTLLDGSYDLLSRGACPWRAGSGFPLAELRSPMGSGCHRSLLCSFAKISFSKRDRSTRHSAPTSKTWTSACACAAWNAAAFLLALPCFASRQRHIRSSELSLNSSSIQKPITACGTSLSRWLVSPLWTRRGRRATALGCACLQQGNRSSMVLRQAGCATHLGARSATVLHTWMQIGSLQTSLPASAAFSTGKAIPRATPIGVGTSVLPAAGNPKCESEQ